jgi:hypothetical protein
LPELSGVTELTSVSLHVPSLSVAIHSAPLDDWATGPSMQNEPVQLTTVGRAATVDAGNTGSVTDDHVDPLNSSMRGLGPCE